ncbi:MAG: hypothetical protein Q9195_002042 [Heterodermia aff. obscurata]
MTRVTSFSELLQVMIEAGEEAPGIHDAWKLTEESVREYYQSISNAVDRARKGAVVSTILNAGLENERQALRQIAIRNIETVHMLMHSSFMKSTMRSQERQGQQLDAIMGHMSAQFEMLRADLGHLNKPAQIAVQSLGDQEAGVSRTLETD